MHCNSRLTACDESLGSVKNLSAQRVALRKVFLVSFVAGQRRSQKLQMSYHRRPCPEIIPAVT